MATLADYQKAFAGSSGFFPTPPPAPPSPLDLATQKTKLWWRTEARPAAQEFTPFGREGFMSSMYSGLVKGVTAGTIEPEVNADTEFEKTVKEVGDIVGMIAATKGIGALARVGQVARVNRIRQIVQIPAVSAAIYGLARDTGQSVGSHEDTMMRLKNAGTFAGTVALLNQAGKITEPHLINMLRNSLPIFKQNESLARLMSDVIFNIPVGAGFGAMEALPGERLKAAGTGALTFGLGVLPFQMAGYKAGRITEMATKQRMVDVLSRIKEGREKQPSPGITPELRTEAPSKGVTLIEGKEAVTAAKEAQRLKTVERKAISKEVSQEQRFQDAINTINPETGLPILSKDAIRQAQELWDGLRNADAREQVIKQVEVDGFSKVLEINRLGPTPAQELIPPSVKGKAKVVTPGQKAVRQAAIDESVIDEQPESWEPVDSPRYITEKNTAQEAVGRMMPEVRDALKVPLAAVVKEGAFTVKVKYDLGEKKLLGQPAYTSLSEAIKDAENHTGVIISYHTPSLEEGIKSGAVMFQPPSAEFEQKYLNPEGILMSQRGKGIPRDYIDSVLYLKGRSDPRALGKEIENIIARQDSERPITLVEVTASDLDAYERRLDELPAGIYNDITQYGSKLKELSQRSADYFAESGPRDPAFIRASNITAAVSRALKIKPNLTLGEIVNKALQLEPEARINPKTGLPIVAEQRMKERLNARDTVAYMQANGFPIKRNIKAEQLLMMPVKDVIEVPKFTLIPNFEIPKSQLPQYDAKSLAQAIKDGKVIRLGEITNLINDLMAKPGKLDSSMVVPDGTPIGYEYMLRRLGKGYENKIVADAIRNIVANNPGQDIAVKADTFTSNLEPLFEAYGNYQKALLELSAGETSLSLETINTLKSNIAQRIQELATELGDIRVPKNRQMSFKEAKLYLEGITADRKKLYYEVTDSEQLNAWFKSGRMKGIVTLDGKPGFYSYTKDGKKEFRAFPGVMSGTRKYENYRNALSREIRTLQGILSNFDIEAVSEVDGEVSDLVQDWFNERQHRWYKTELDSPIEETFERGIGAAGRGFTDPFGGKKIFILQEPISLTDSKTGETRMFQPNEVLTVDKFRDLPSGEREYYITDGNKAWVTKTDLDTLFKYHQDWSNSGVEYSWFNDLKNRRRAFDFSEMEKLRQSEQWRKQDVQNVLGYAVREADVDEKTLQLHGREIQADWNSRWVDALKADGMADSEQARLNVFRAKEEIFPADPSDHLKVTRSKVGIDRRIRGESFFDALGPAQQRFASLLASTERQFLQEGIDRGLFSPQLLKYRDVGYNHHMHVTPTGEVFGDIFTERISTSIYKRGKYNTIDEAIKGVEGKGSISTDFGKVIEHYITEMARMVRNDNIARILEHARMPDGGPMLAYPRKMRQYGLTNMDGYAVLPREASMFNRWVNGKYNQAMVRTDIPLDRWIVSSLTKKGPPGVRSMGIPAWYSIPKTFVKMWQFVLNPAYSWNVFNFLLPTSGPVGTAKAMLFNDIGYRNYSSPQQLKYTAEREGLNIGKTDRLMQIIADDLAAETKKVPIIQKMVYDNWGFREFLSTRIQSAAAQAWEIKRVELVNKGLEPKEAARTASIMINTAIEYPGKYVYSGFTGDLLNYSVFARNSTVSFWRTILGAAGQTRGIPGKPGEQLFGTFGLSDQAHAELSGFYRKQLMYQMVSFALTAGLISKMTSGIYPWQRKDQTKWLDMATGIMDRNGAEIMITPPLFKSIRDLNELTDPRAYVINKMDPTLKSIIELVAGGRLLPTGIEAFSEPGATFGERLTETTLKKLVSLTPLARLALPQDVVNKYGELYPKSKFEEVLQFGGFRTKRVPGAAPSYETAGMTMGQRENVYRTYQEETRRYQAEQSRLLDDMERAWVSGDMEAFRRIARVKYKDPKGYKIALQRYMLKKQSPLAYQRKYLMPKQLRRELGV